MATTSAALIGNDGVHLAFALVIDGLPLAFTSHDSASDMATAWAGTDWATSSYWHTGLHIIGTTSQEIQPFNPKIQSDSLSFVITDSDDVATETFFAEALTTAKKTYLTENLDANDVACVVASNAGFAASGTLYCGNETMTYSGTLLSTSFTGLTRGMFSPFTTEGSARFSEPHTIATDETAGEFSDYKVEVWDKPRTFYNRRVALYVHHFEAGIPVTKANSSLVWVGRIKEIRDPGDGSIQLSCVSILEQVETASLFDEQWSAQLLEGKRISGYGYTPQLAVDSLYVPPSPGVVTSRSNSTDDCLGLGNSSARFTHDQIANGIATQLNAWATANSIYGDTWWLYLVEGKYRLMCNVTGAAKYMQMRVGLSPSIWRFLGWSGIENITTVDPVYQNLATDGDDWLYLQAPDPPRRTDTEHLFIGAQLDLDPNTIKGTWLSQPTMPGSTGSSITSDGASYTPDAFLQIGTEVYAAAKSGSTIIVGPDVTEIIAPLQRKDDTNVRRIEPSDADTPIAFKQIWIEHGMMGELFLNLMLSTGANAFNSTYDTYPRSMGVKLPWSLVDTVSTYFGLGGFPYWLVLTKPTPFVDLLESALAVRGGYMVWADGKLSIRFPGEVPSAQTTWALTESNKGGAGANDPDHTTVGRSSDGIINRITLDYALDGEGKFQCHMPIAMFASISDFGQSKPVTVKGFGIYPKGTLGNSNDPVTAWASTVASSALAYWSRPVCIAERSYDRTLFAMAPGDTCTITDNSIPDPTTGSRGVVTWPAWILGVSFDWRKMVGKVRLAFLPEHGADELAIFGPSANVTSSAVVLGSLVLTCEAHRYSDSTQGNDVSFFAATNICRLIEVSPSAPAGGTKYDVTVASVNSGANQITLNENPAGGALSTSKRWVLEFGSLEDVNADQYDYAYIAEEPSQRTNVDARPFYRYGTAPRILSSNAVTSRVYRRARSDADDMPMPLSVHKIADVVDACNCLKAYKCRQVQANKQWASGSGPQIAGTAWSLFTAQPIFLHGNGTDGLSFASYGKCTSGTAEVRFTVSRTMPAGTALTQTTYWGSTRSATATIGTTNLIYASATMSSAAVGAGDLPVWLSVEGRVASGSGTLQLQGFTVYGS